MPDNRKDQAQNPKQAPVAKQAPPKPAAPPKPPKPAPDADAAAIHPKHKVGIVELVMIMLLVAVIFIFIFGMQQMKRDKERELLLSQKVEALLPTFVTIADSAKAYQARDPFAAWPLNIEEMNLPANINTAEFKFSFAENGVVTATSTKEFGKEGIKINFDIPSATYNVDDPQPTEKPIIKDQWLSK